MVYCLFSLILFSCSDAAGKYLNRTLPPVEIGWIRYLVFCIFIAPPFLRRGVRVLRTAHPWLQAIRSLGLALATLFFILATRFLPMAEATATHYVCPLLITALSIPVLGETVGWRRWTATAVGMIGVLVVMRPLGATFQAAAILPLFSATFSAVAMVLTRKLAYRDSAATMLAWSAILGFLAMSALLPLGFVVPNAVELTIGIGIGVVTSAAQWLVVLAYRNADASLLAPFSYCQIIFSALLGYAIFGNAPDGWSYAGAALIIGSGLYTARRNRDVAKPD